MTTKELKKLENDLWDTANTLRATGGIKSSDYAVPVLGIIFLRFADNKYDLVEADILKEFEKNRGTRAEVSIEKIAVRTCGIYLSESSRYEYLLNLPSSQSMAEAIKNAMEDIEKHQDEQFKDILPKDAYAEIENNSSEILPKLIKTFSDIPKDASGDVFGKIYEYFLGKFALSEGQKGGEFFTPTSVVKFIVETIEPYKGKIFDPACGSGGMFVQSANFLERTKHTRDAIYVCGQENEQSTVKLAKMNLLVNNLSGEIKKANSYEENPYNSKGKFDFVMANPPFNVKGVKESAVKNDERFTEYGLPKNKDKKDDKITDANYLWISLFATSLNDKGRAGFVMPNSASDARNSEGEIRKKIVDSGIVEVMVTIPSNMFYTVTLPATLWFFDKEKVNTPRKDKILFIDARAVYNQIDRAHREWTDEQVQNLASIVRLHRGEKERYLELIARYIESFQENIEGIEKLFDTYHGSHDGLILALKSYQEKSESKRKKEACERLKSSGFLEDLEKLQTLETPSFPSLKEIKSFDTNHHDNSSQISVAKKIGEVVQSYHDRLKTIQERHYFLLDTYKSSEKYLKLKADKTWGELALVKKKLFVELNFNHIQEKLESICYWYQNIEWLQSKFPDAKYVDIVGLCKVALRDEYVDEEDYSLNAGRYVGITLEDKNITEEEFKASLQEKHQKLQVLNEQAHVLEKLIDENMSKVL